MKIRYKGPQTEGVTILDGDNQFEMPRLTVVDVRSDLAERLLEQEDCFERAPVKKSTAAAKKKTAAKEPAPELDEDQAGDSGGVEDSPPVDVDVTANDNTEEG